MEGVKSQTGNRVQHCPPYN